MVLSVAGSWLVVGGSWLVVMRVRLDYGTEGLEVDLPDERVTVIEPMPRAAALPARQPWVALRVMMSSESGPGMMFSSRPLTTNNARS